MLRTVGIVSAWVAIVLVSCLAVAQQPQAPRKSLRIQLPKVPDTFAPEVRVTTPRSRGTQQTGDAPSPRVTDRVREFAKARIKVAASADPLAALGASGPAAYSAGGSHLVAAVRGGGGLALWDTKSSRRLHRLENSDRRYALVAISDEAQWIVAVRQDNSDLIDLWQADSGRHVRVIRAGGGAKSLIAFTGADELHVQAAGGDGFDFSIPNGTAIGGSSSRQGGAAVRRPSLRMEGPKAAMPAAPSTSRAEPRGEFPLERELETKDDSHTFGQGAPTPVLRGEPRIRTSPPRLGSAPPRATSRIPREPMPPMPAAAAPAPRAAAPAASAPDEPEVSGDAPPEPSGGSAPEPQLAPSVAAPDEPSFAPAAPAPDEISVDDAPAGGSAPDSLESLLAAPAEISPGSAGASPTFDAEGGGTPDEAEVSRGLPGAAETSELADEEPPMAEEEATRGGPVRSFRFEMSPEDVERSAAAPEMSSDTSEPSETEQPPVAVQPSTQAPSASSVTIHYATNRNRLAPKDRHWTVYFRGFFGSLPAFVIYGLVILAVLVFPWLGRRSWAAAAVLTGAFSLCGMAGVEAYVRSQLRDEMSGELYGCRPTDLAYGSCEISVPPPRNRRAGDLSRPLSVWVFEAPEDPDKHFVLRHVEEHKDKDAFYHSLSWQLGKSDDRAAFLFIHGYNVSFEDAIFRTAQLAVDLKFPGAPVAFCWPSYADPVKYPFDEQNAEVSIPALREVLDDLATRSGARRIHIIAHSMGNRVLAGALRSMDSLGQARSKAAFNELVLAAPDIDCRVFRSQVLPHIVRSTQHCTLYASSRDRALLMSRCFHNYQRLGESQPELLIDNGLDTIDASLVDTSLLGHSYIGDVQSIVSDLHDLVVAGKRATERLGLELLERDALKYWSIRPELEASADDSLRR